MTKKKKLADYDADFAHDFLSEMKDEDTFVLGDGDGLAEFDDYIDTGSYALNALISGSIFGGVPNTKRVVYASDPGVGKSFMILTAIKNHLEADPDNIAILYDTETAQTKGSLEARGIDVSRVIVSYKGTVEEFRNHLLNFCEKYLARPEGSRPSCLVALDSLSQLSSLKEVGDIRDGNDKRDMTKQQLIKGAFRALTIPLSRSKMPMFIACHVYDEIGAMYASKKVAGGQGAQYAADTLVMLSKAQDKDKDGTHIGTIVTARTTKSRFTREKSSVKLRISFDHGLDRHYGLVDLALRGGIFKKVSTRIELPDGSTAFESQINKDPEKYFTSEVLQQIDVAAGELFKFGGALGHKADHENLEEPDAVRESSTEVFDVE